MMSREWEVCAHIRLATLEEVKAKIKERWDVLDGQTEGCTSGELIAIEARNLELYKIAQWLDRQIAEGKS